MRPTFFLMWFDVYSQRLLLSESGQNYQTVCHIPLSSFLTSAETSRPFCSCRVSWSISTLASQKLLRAYGMSHLMSPARFQAFECKDRLMQFSLLVSTGVTHIEGIQQGFSDDSYSDDLPSYLVKKKSHDQTLCREDFYLQFIIRHLIQMMPLLYVSMLKELPKYLYIVLGIDIN